MKKPSERTTITPTISVMMMIVFEVPTIPSTVVPASSDAFQASFSAVWAVASTVSPPFFISGRIVVRSFVSLSTHDFGGDQVFLRRLVGTLDPLLVFRASARPCAGPRRAC